MQHRCIAVHYSPYTDCRCKCGDRITQRGAYGVTRTHLDPWETPFGCHGELVWAEDDATLNDPDRTSLRDAYRTATLKDYDPKDTIAAIDVMDGEFRLMPTGVIILASYPGANALWKAEGLRIYLDDVRPLPQNLVDAGYYLIKDPAVLLKYIADNGLKSIETLSLDNDLGGKIEGRHVLDEVERRVMLLREHPPLVQVHSANPVAQQAMKVVIDRLAGQAFQLALQND